MFYDLPVKADSHRRVECFRCGHLLKNKGIQDLTRFEK